MTTRATYADSLDDRLLVARARGGDRAAMDALLRRHHRRVYNVCRRVTGNDADALDATQEALIAIVRGIARFDGSSAFTAWAHRVATNASIDELRRRRRRPIPHAFADHEGERDAIAPIDAAAAIDDDVANRGDIATALAGIAPDYRAAVFLRDLCGLDYARIATMLGIPAGTVRSRISRGRAAMLPLVA